MAAEPAGSGGWSTVGRPNVFELPANATNLSVCRKNLERTNAPPNILSRYEEEFGCSDTNRSKWPSHKENYTRKFQKAKQCLTRRIQKLGNYSANTPDNKVKRKQHLYPIKTAYTLGRNCLRKFTTRKNADNIFTDSVNRRLRSIGKSNVLHDPGYGLHPSIRQRIFEPELKTILKSNYGMNAEAWNAEYGSRLPVGEVTLSNEASNSNSNESVKEVKVRNDSAKVGGGGATEGGGAIEGGGSAKEGGGGAKEGGGSAKAGKSKKSKKQIPVSKSSSNDLLLTQSIKEKISTALFFAKNFLLFESLTLFFFELRTVVDIKLSEETKERLTKLIASRHELTDTYFKLDKTMDLTDLLKTAKENSHKELDLKDVPPTLLAFQQATAKLDEDILSFLLENGICKSNEERIRRQDAILNDITEKTKKCRALFLKSLEEAKTYTEKACYDDIAQNINAFRPTINLFINYNNNLSVLKGMRPPTPTPDFKIDTFPEFKDFYRTHLAIRSKC